MWEREIVDGWATWWYDTIHDKKVGNQKSKINSWYDSTIRYDTRYKKNQKSIHDLTTMCIGENWRTEICESWFGFDFLGLVQDQCISNLN